MKKYCLFLFTVILLTGCSHYTVNKEGYIRPPEHYKFPYNKKASQIADTGIIDTTCVYVLQNSNYYRHTDQYKNDNNYIRFYADGRFKQQGFKTAFTIEEVNNNNKGIVGFYMLMGNVVKLQFYSDMNGGSDQLEFGMVNEAGKLVMLHENPRTDFGLGYSEKGIRKKINNSYFNPKVYEKIKLEGLTYIKPEW